MLPIVVKPPSFLVLRQIPSVIKTLLANHLAGEPFLHLAAERRPHLAAVDRMRTEHTNLELGVSSQQRRRSFARCIAGPRDSWA